MSIRYYLTISSFQGLVGWASHWYGRLRNNVDENFEEDIRVNGTTRLNSKSDVRMNGKKWFKEHAKKGDVLICGNYAFVSPQELLCGPPDLVEKANKLWLKYEKMEADCDYSSEELNAVDNEWNALMDAHDLPHHPTTKKTAARRRKRK